MGTGKKRKSKGTGTKVRDRVQGFKRIHSSAIVANEKNHRRHPVEQRTGLSGMLDEIGMASACIVRPIDGGKYQLIDGHLRHDMLKGQDVPCLIIDVSSDEADKLLATMDGLSLMADVDLSGFQDLIDGLSVTNEDASNLLDSLAPFSMEGDTDEDISMGDEIDTTIKDTDLSATGTEPITLTNNAIFLPTSNQWDIPELDPGMLTEIPEPIDCWAGDMCCKPDDSEWWLYITSTGTRGLPFEKSVVGFFCDDYRWDRIWTDPAKNVGYLITRGIGYALEPNFSLYPNLPRLSHLEAVYKTRYIGRYMQKVGLRVIPCVQWCDPYTLEWCCLGIPIGCPAIAVQLHTCEGSFTVESTGQTLNKAETNIKCLQEVLDRIQPKSLMVYGAPGNVDGQLKHIKYEGRIVKVPSHSYRRKQEKKVW